MEDGAQMPVGRFRGRHVAETGSERQHPSVVNLLLKSEASKARWHTDPLTHWFPSHSKKEHMLLQTESLWYNFSFCHIICTKISHRYFTFLILFSSSANQELACFVNCMYSYETTKFHIAKPCLQRSHVTLEGEAPWGRFEEATVLRQSLAQNE